MFRLQLPTDPRWVNIATQDLQEILTDHAWCEQKAASSAISLMVQFPEYPELVRQMSALAQEEMEHFQRVFALLQEKGLSLGRERKDAYVGALLEFQQRGNSAVHRLRDKLLMAALIEARSCERFRLLCAGRVIAGVGDAANATTFAVTTWMFQGDFVVPDNLVVKVGDE